MKEKHHLRDRTTRDAGREPQTDPLRPPRRRYVKPCLKETEPLVLVALQTGGVTPPTGEPVVPP
ncbi:MAG: hypothetical protein QME96_01440 [Myxococcota bacterium]|nr:hypothetical protein [Myxococcota bacterium]